MSCPKPKLDLELVNALQAMWDVLDQQYKDAHPDVPTRRADVWEAAQLAAAEAARRKKILKSKAATVREINRLTKKAKKEALAAQRVARVKAQDAINMRRASRELLRRFGL